MNKFCKKWSKNTSPSRNPWKCNFNRDTFIDSILSKLNIDFTKAGIDALIFDIIIVVNENAKRFTIENNIKTYKKCQFYNFYIMYLSTDTIKAKIEESSLLN